MAGSMPHGVAWLLSVGVLLAGRGLANGQSTYRVELDGIEFIPADVTIDVGDTVHWVWVSGFHNVESGIVENGAGHADGHFRSGDPGFGLTYDLTFDEAFLETHPTPRNLFPYFCVVHAGLGMVGSVTVIPQGDINRDGRVNLEDHAMLIECLAGPGGAADPALCPTEQLEASDQDQDGDADLKDFLKMQRAFAS